MKIGYESLFDFNDKAPLTDAIKNIDALMLTYLKFVSAVEESNQRLAVEQSEVIKTTKILYDNINKLTGPLQQNEKLITETAEASGNLVKQDQALAKQEAENAKAIQALNDQIKILKDAKDKVTKATQGEAGSYSDLKKKADDASKALNNMGTATNQVVKEDQIKKVAELNEQVKSVKAGLDQAKQSAIIAAGSYNELSSRVVNAKKELKSMEGGLKGNSQEFMNLKKFVKEGGDQLKKWDEAVGDNQRHVGDYKNQLSTLIPGFQGVAGSIEQATTAGKAFISSPLGLVIGGIALAVGSLIAYFKGSIEGQDRWNKVVAYGEALFEMLLDVLESVGKAVFEFGQALTQPKKLFEDFLQLIKPLRDGIMSVFEDPLGALKKFGDFIFDSIIVRLKALGVAVDGINKVFKGDFKAGFKELGNAVIQATTGIENGVDKITAAANQAAAALAALTAKAVAEAARRLAIAEKIANLENKIRKERIKDVVDDANTELEQNKLLEDSKDKLTFADEERLAKVRMARKLLNEQVAGDITLAKEETDLQRLKIEQAGGILDVNKRLSDLSEEELKGIGVKYELVEKLAQLEAEEVRIASDASNKRKGLLKQEATLIQEIAREYFDRIARTKKADEELNKFLLNNVIHRNQEILDNEDATLDELLTVIQSNQEAQLQLLEMETKNQLDLAKQAALDKVELNSDTLLKIYNDTSKSLEQQIQAERDAKEVALMNDEKFLVERQILEKNQEKINDQYLQSVEDTNTKALKAVEDNVFKVLERDGKNFLNFLQTEANNEVTALNEAFANGNVSFFRFQKERQAIIVQAMKDQISAQIDTIDQELQTQGLSNVKKLELEKKLSDLRKQLSTETADEIYNNEKALIEETNNLRLAAFDFGQELVDAGVQRNIEALEMQLAKERDTADAKLRIVGDDKQAQALIEQDFANKQIAIQNQVNQQKRKAALFDKARSATEIIISTARAVVETLPNIPLSILIGAIGGLNLAKVLATPIPAFWTGTNYSPEGLAMVAERGPELGIDQSGKKTLYKEPQLAFLKRGTKILNNEKTEKFIQDFKDQQLFDNTLGSMKDSNLILSQPDVSIDISKVASAIKDSERSIVGAIQSMPQDVWDDEGYRRNNRRANGRVQRLDKRHRLQ